MTHQPQSYMVQSLRDRDRTVNQLKDRVKTLEDQLASSMEDRAKLAETKNQMAADLEKLLSHREV